MIKVHYFGISCFLARQARLTAGLAASCRSPGGERDGTMAAREHVTAAPVTTGASNADESSERARQQ
jgi:hypothetical protein